MKILVDSKEPPQVAQLIAAHPLLSKPEIASLPTGDIWIDDLVIERKEVQDLLASITDGRLFNQCAEMRQQSQWCYVLIIGQLVYGPDGRLPGTPWRLRQIQGALLKVQELGVNVVFALDSADLAPTLYWLATRQRCEKLYLPLRIGVPVSEKQKVLMSFPGVGAERAAELLERYNLIDALLCLINEDCKVSGIGPKTKQNIRNLLCLAQGEFLQKVVKQND